MVQLSPSPTPAPTPPPCAPGESGSREGARHGPEGLDLGAPQGRLGFATVRTDPTKPRHAGVTMMVIDMEAPEVEVRPLRQATGDADFNEVFFEGVFVPDDDVVGAVDDGWSVARATLATSASRSVAARQASSARHRRPLSPQGP